MYKPSLIVDPKLRVAAGLVETAVPRYDIKQSDPLIAAKEGVGNCVSKAVIGAVLLGFARFIGPEPALAWNIHTHPKIGDDMFGKTKIQNGHAQLLVAGTTSTENIQAMSFNPDGTGAHNWEVFNFNEDEEYAAVENNIIVATNVGKTVGFEIHEWHNGGKLYCEAVGLNDTAYHRHNAQELSEQIIVELRTRDLLITL